MHRLPPCRLCHSHREILLIRPRDAYLCGQYFVSLNKCYNEDYEILQRKSGTGAVDDAAGFFRVAFAADVGGHTC